MDRKCNINFQLIFLFIKILKILYYTCYRRKINKIFILYRNSSIWYGDTILGIYGQHNGYHKLC